MLRSGQRLHITGYERRGDRVELRLQGGFVQVDSADLVAIEPEEIFPARVFPGAKPPYAELIRSAAERHGVDPELVASVVAMESNFNPRAVSHRDARGLMQLRPETAARLGVTDVFDARQNIEAGTRYLRELLDRYQHDLVLTLAAYNAGPDRVETYRGVPPFMETISYVHKVRREYQRRKLRPPAQKPDSLDKAARSKSRRTTGRSNGQQL